MDEAYLKVDINRIGNNADQAAYQEIYLENIDNHVLAVQSIERKIESAVKTYEEYKEEIEKQIVSVEKRRIRISAE